MDTSSRGFRIGIGVLSAAWVPFWVTAMYRVMPSGWLWPGSFFLPFVAIGLLGLWAWRFTRWRSIGVGILAGLAIYAVFLTWLLWAFSRGPAIP